VHLTQNTFLAADLILGQLASDVGTGHFLLSVITPVILPMLMMMML